MDDYVEKCPACSLSEKQVEMLKERADWHLAQKLVEDHLRQKRAKMKIWAWAGGWAFGVGSLALLLFGKRVSEILTQGLG